MNEDKETLDYYLNGGFKPVDKMYEEGGTSPKYLTLNNALYQALIAGGRKKEFQPVEFFNTIYSMYYKYVECINYPEKWDKYAKTLPYTPDQIVFLHLAMFPIIMLNKKEIVDQMVDNIDISDLYSKKP